MSQIRVLIYGDSLLLASARAILEKSPAVEMAPPTPPWDVRAPNAATAVEPAPPDIVLFDAMAVNLPALFAAFRHIPALRFIGLDGARQSALVVHGQTHRVILPDDLTHLILER